MYRCHSCGGEVAVAEKTGRAEVCPRCDADLHCCLNCTFHDEGVYNQCRESQAERVVDKSRSNFCDYFVFCESADKKTAAGPLRSRANPLDALFKKNV